MRGRHAGRRDLPQFAHRADGISQATDFNWKKRYSSLLPDEMRRLKALEDENNRPKKTVAT